MDDRGANIDLVFRNGLKDYEVLPPQEVWNSIHPVIRRKQKPVILLKAAALIIVLFSLSLFAYRLSRNITREFNDSMLASNVEYAYPENTPVINRPVAITTKEDISKSIYKNEIITSTFNAPENPESIIFVSSSNGLSGQPSGSLIDDSTPDSGPQLASLNTSDNSFFEIEDINSSFLPLNENLKPAERWSVSALASPTYNSSFNTGKNELMNQLLATEQPMVSYSGGVALTYKINKRFSIQSGIFYSSVGQEVGGINSFGGFQKYDNTKGSRNFEVLTSSGLVYTKNADVFLSSDGPVERVLTEFNNDVFDPEKASLNHLNDNLLQNFSYLELPVLLRYKLVDRTIDLNLIGGVSYNMLVNNSVYTMVDGNKYFVGETEGLNLFSLSSSIGMGMEYSFSKNLSLNLEPTLRYYLNPFNQVSAPGTHLYSFGLFSGISYKF